MDVALLFQPEINIAVSVASVCEQQVIIGNNVPTFFAC